MKGVVRKFKNYVVEGLKSQQNFNDLSDYDGDDIESLLKIQIQTDLHCEMCQNFEWMCSCCQRNKRHCVNCHFSRVKSNGMKPHLMIIGISNVYQDLIASLVEMASGDRFVWVAEDKREKAFYFPSLLLSEGLNDRDGNEQENSKDARNLNVMLLQVSDSEAVFSELGRYFSSERRKESLVNFVVIDTGDSKIENEAAAIADLCIDIDTLREYFDMHAKLESRKCGDEQKKKLLNKFSHIESLSRLIKSYSDP